MIEQDVLSPNRLDALNIASQRVEAHPIFNNWHVLPEAWYFLLRSDELPIRGVSSVQILQQRLVVYRGESGQVRVLDAFCPHMGTDLALGKVRGENIECFFHRWQFSGDGHCRLMPTLGDSAMDKDFGLTAYPVEEKYGLIWVYAGANALVPILEVPDLEGKEIIYSLGEINRNLSHHHISMINGLDAQHLRTVHGLSIEMDITASEEGQQIQFILSGPVPKKSIIDRAMHALFGPHYSFSMKYSQASIASLTLLRDVYFLRKSWRWPRLHMLYAYRPGKDGMAETQPIYVTERRKGLLGLIKARFSLWLTKKAYFFLKDEDDKIYDNIRFTSKHFLGIDKTVLQYIRWVNQLYPSSWTPLKKEER